MTCRELIEFLMAYDDGELPPEQRGEFDRHLNLCPSCVAYLDSYRKTVKLGRLACGKLDEPVPCDVPDELVRAILAARNPPPQA